MKRQAELAPKHDLSAFLTHSAPQPAAPVPDLEEGSTCPKCQLGKLSLPPVENCSCHTSPPCSACTDRVLECKDCGWKEGEVDELQQQLGEMRKEQATGDDVAALAPPSEVDVRYQCLEHIDGDRCPKIGTFALTWAQTTDDIYPVYYCEAHIKQFQFAGSTAIINPFTPPAEAPVTAVLSPEQCGDAVVAVENPSEWICSTCKNAIPKSEKVYRMASDAQLCEMCYNAGEVPPVRAPEVPMVGESHPFTENLPGATEEVPWKQQCIASGSLKDPASDSRKNRATVYLDGNPEHKYCDEHASERNHSHRKTCRIVDWVDGKPVGEPDPSPDVVVHQAKDWKCFRCNGTFTYPCGAVREGQMHCQTCAEFYDSQIFPPSRGKIEHLKDLRQEILDLCIHKHGNTSDITVYETLGVLRVVEHDLLDMLEQHNGKPE